MNSVVLKDECAPSAGSSEEAGGSGVGGVRSVSEQADVSAAARPGAAAGRSGPADGRLSQQTVGRAQQQHQEQRTGAAPSPVRFSGSGCDGTEVVMFILVSHRVFSRRGRFISSITTWTS